LTLWASVSPSPKTGASSLVLATVTVMVMVSELLPASVAIRVTTY